MVNKNLTGRKEILVYTRRSWEIVWKWIKKEDFPARKLDGVWESSTDLIDEWKRGKITKNPSK
jgi:hypothetical protein